MDALQVCAVMPAARDEAEQTAATAPLNPLAREFAPATAPPALNPLAREFVPAVGRATASLNPHAMDFVPAGVPALNPLAMDFVPAGAPALNPLAMDFVPVGAPALNPLAREFLPWWHVGGGLSADAPEFFVTSPDLYYPAAGAYYLSNAIPPMTSTSRISNYSQRGRARFSQRVQRMNKEEFVRKTVYVTNIDQTVTEEMLAQLFERCGIVVDCRLCGDPTSGFRFAFVEFLYQEDAFNALNLDGEIIGIFPIKVAPSRTAIMPIRHSFLPQSEEEKARSSRTVYCTNIRKTVTQDELINFFQIYFGPVSQVKLMGHDNQSTKIAFIEFMEFIGAIAALNSSGIYVKGLIIRVNPSKTPIRMAHLQ